MKFKFFFLFCFLAIKISFSQDLKEYQSIENLKSTDLKMYNLLVEGIYNKTRDTLSTHIFPLFKKVVTDEDVSISTIAYLKPRSSWKRVYEIKDSQIYCYSIKFVNKKVVKENLEDLENYVILDPTPSKSDYPPRYTLMVKDDGYSKKNNGYVVYRIVNEKPFYHELYDKVKLTYNKVRENLVDISLYKNIVYDKVQFINKNIVILKNQNKVGIINSSNDTLVPFDFKKVTMFNNCIVAEKENSKKSMFDNNFKLVGEFEGLEIFNPSNYVQRYVDGFLTINNQLRSYYSFSNYKKMTGDYSEIIGANKTFTVGIKDNKSTLINLNTWKETTFDSINIPQSQTFKEDELIIQNKFGEKWGVLRITDKIETILEPKYESICQNVVLDVDTNYREVRYIVNKKDKYALYDSKLGWLTEFEFKNISFLNNHYLMRKGKKILLFDANGTLMTKTKYDKIELNDDKQFIGYKKSKYEIIETK
ncbi:hypothetical protein LY01_01087 [Nonlabens xylanidelens]|uniref:WG repeat protein n=1 Tax=Nonlabens xylanidelens TaxID=191564 RepID=A0A2S6IMR4_9FLAO|nr:hypothetical protein [Nonlabens xylanidelens]PPK95499.1 hypothetical protein LY01_01087 [Nonlabens xylanidelens]PQJ22312.1 hypothetical protein BST94_01695 [Nonlabens xylanidelens]